MTLHSTDWPTQKKRKHSQSAYSSHILESWITKMMFDDDV